MLRAKGLNLPKVFKGPLVRGNYTVVYTVDYTVIFTVDYTVD